LFVSPHLDDVALSCGGIVGRHVEANQSVVVATCFAQAPQPSSPLTSYAKSFHRECGVGELDTERLWQLRQAEDAAAAQLLGAHHLWLAYHDAIYRGDRYCSDEQLFGQLHPDDGPLVEQLAAEIVSLWRGTDRATVYLPLGVGGHADHQICFGAGARLREAGASVWYYEELPYALSSRDAVARRVSEVRPTLTARSVDITAHVDRRVNAIAAYTSQLPLMFESRDAMAALVREFAGTYARDPGRYAERLWSTSDDMPGGLA
jgi:LmbE family N-acetylglucosaminyl deacetylase